MKPTLAITIGDPAGIGPLVTAANLNFSASMANLVIFGHWPTFLQALKKFHDIPKVQLVENYTKNIAPICFVNTCDFLNPIQKPGTEAAKSALLALEKAIEHTKNKDCDALVTAPLSKEYICAIQPGFTGHTEFLAQKCNLKNDDVTMVFATPKLVIGLISTHLPLKDVPAAITEDHYFRTLKHTIDITQKAFKIKKTSIVIPGLNPHAGEGGLLGKEEQEIIMPFCKKYQGFEGAQITGPMAQEAAYRDAFAGKYNALIAAYHDQALIPLKLNGFGAVNITAGLPFLRTSPDHGTAYDIAATGAADCEPMKQAIYLAASLIQN